jgi:hypothetical protein
LIILNYNKNSVAGVRMFLRLLDKLGRKRIVYDRIDSQPYLERYYVFIKDRKRFPFNVFLHKFLKSDPDDLHDHPWGYLTLILRGGYWEYTPTGKYWRGPGHFRFCGAGSTHRIELDPAITAWTLFMPGPQKKEWGFISNGKWIQHEEYLSTRSNTND